MQADRDRERADAERKAAEAALSAVLAGLALPSEAGESRHLASPARRNPAPPPKPLPSGDESTDFDLAMDTSTAEVPDVDLADEDIVVDVAVEEAPAPKPTPRKAAKTALAARAVATAPVAIIETPPEPTPVPPPRPAPPKPTKTAKRRKSKGEDDETSRKWWRIPILVAGLTAAVYLGYTQFYKTSPSAIAAAQNRAPLQVAEKATANQLIEAYAKNPKAGTTQYAEKLIQLTGKVDKVVEDSNIKYVLLEKPDKVKWSIRLNFADPTQISSIKVGDEITVHGEVQPGPPRNFLELNICRLVKAEK
jgi:hypothetical protein